MLLLQLPPEPEVPGWIADAVKFLALFFFIGLPIIRSIRESLQKRAEAEGAGKASELDKRARDGRQAWEELMRGSREAEPAEGAAPPVPAPPPVPVQAAAQSEPRAGAAPASSRSLSEDFRAAPVLTHSTAEREAPDEEELAERELAQREREGLERQIDRSRQREELGSAFERTPEPLLRVGSASALGDSKDAEKAATRASEAAARRPARSKWRRAVVLNEVLGAPVSERGPADRSRPAGLRP